MGAWGPGMQANDTALDAIDSVKKLLSNLKLSLPEYLEKHGIEPLLRVAQTCDVQDSFWGVLGVTEYILDVLDKYPLGFKEKSSIKFEYLILDSITAELQIEKLKEWREPKEREQALLLLEKRIFIGLSEAQREKIKESNQGLFTRLLKHINKGA